MSHARSLRFAVALLLVCVLAAAVAVPVLAAPAGSLYIPLVSVSETQVRTADDIGNDLDSSLDTVAEVMPLNVGGAPRTTTLYVTPRNGDGKNGCNLTGSTTLVVSISSSNTSVATVDPSSITFESCGDTKTLTVIPANQGSATIAVSQTSNNTGGTFDLAAAAFTVNVAPPSNTAPQVTIGGVSAGASYKFGSVPAANCQVTDTEDGNSSFAATLSAITGPYASDGIGSQTASCSYTDGGGLAASASSTYSIVDPSAPSISYTLNPASPDGSNGWYKGNVSLTWNVNEPESPKSLQKTGCVDQNITSDQAETTYNCSATSAGGTASESVTIKRDATAPTISGSASPAANGAGWNNSDVTVSFTCGDVLSGVASCEPNQTLSVDGAGLSAAGTAVDNAGNSATATVSGINIDKTAPTNIKFSGDPADGGTYYFGSVPAAPTCSADAAISGLASCVVSGYSAAIGQHTLTATATDNAGNVGTATSSYTVLAWTLKGFYQPVDMNGVYNTVKNGSTVPLKFELFAGSTELTDVSKINQLTYAQTSCDATAVTDDIETVATGGTVLRYDATGGQFIYNWKTPSTAGKCYRVTMAAQDGSSLVAYFKLK